MFAGIFVADSDGVYFIPSFSGLQVRSVLIYEQLRWRWDQI